MLLLGSYLDKVYIRLSRTSFGSHGSAAAFLTGRGAAKGEGPGATRYVQRSAMNLFDLFKATIICGLLAFLIYSFPVVGQVVIIGLLSLLWLSYAHRTIANLRRR
jgi:hypothetical protein